MPGATGCSETNFVQDMIVGAHKHGYGAVVVNSMSTKEDEGKKEYRVLDFSDSQIITDAIKLVKDKVGNEVEIYGVGFSLGANHLTRYMGAANPELQLISAACSVSNPFDVLASSIHIKYRAFGLFDKVLRSRLIQ